MTNEYGIGYGSFTCPACGFTFAPPTSFGYTPVYNWGHAPGFGWNAPTWGLGGLRTWGGSYSPQYAATGLPTDEEIEEMVYDALDDDPIVPYDAPIDVEVSAGVVTLTGTVPNKRVKHAAGNDSWWIPGVVDVLNNLEVGGMRRSRTAPKEGSTPSTGKSRQ